MKKPVKISSVMLAVGLSGLLFIFTYLVVGFHYETNDDLIISLLLRGILIQPPLQDLTLYFHGLSYGLVWLYRVAPEWPWYGMLLYALLYLATILAGIFLLRRDLKNKSMGLVLLALLFLANWLEHLYLFNYLRVPLLLAGVAYLIMLEPPALANNSGFKCFAGLLFLTALCIRPSAALLGLAVVWPATFLLVPYPDQAVYKWRSLGLLAGIGVTFYMLLSLSQSPAQQEYQRLDWLKSTVLDFEILQFAPKTTQDSTAVQAINHWLLADKQVVNEVFYARAGHISFFIVLKMAVAKLNTLAGILIRDHFLVLALNVFLLFLYFCNHQVGIGINRSLTVGYQVYFWVLVLAIGIFMKLPPRIITSCFSLYTLINCKIVLNTGHQNFIKVKGFKLIGMGLGLLVGLQFYKIYHRAEWQTHNQKTNEALISSVFQTFPTQLIVTNVMPDFFRSLSPFCNYDFSNKSVLLLTGWPTIDPAYQQYYVNLTGQINFREGIKALARNKNTVWVLSPGFFTFLNQYVKTFNQPELRLQPFSGILTKQYPVQVYRSSNFSH